MGLIEVLGAVLVNGLHCLEYRGYDSAGIAVLENEKIVVMKDKGRVFNLDNMARINVLINLKYHTLQFFLVLFSNAIFPAIWQSHSCNNSLSSISSFIIILLGNMSSFI